MYNLQKIKNVGLVTALALTPSFAFAAADVTAATSALTEAATAIGLIGVGMIAAASAGIVYRWVTAFLVK